MSWPPSYILNHSTRAKHVSFQIHPQRGLKITLPKRFAMQDLPSVLEKHRRWIEKNLSKHQISLRNNENEIPEKIFFNALNETWQITYLEKLTSKKVSYTVNHEAKLLQLKVDKNNPKHIKACLNHFLRLYAAKTLLPWLSSLSHAANLPFTKGTVRHADTLWGSCSIKKNISLNCRLLFLPPALVEYVILHELSHTVHLNHSSRFWKFLAQHNPNCLSLRKELRKANQHLPLWIF